MRNILFVILALLMNQTILSQEEHTSIVTDRPDQTESAVTVPHKSLQIESGFTFGWDKNEGIAKKSLGYNATLLRYGIHPRFEFRLGAAYAGFDKENEITGEETSLSGFAPLVAGFKWNFLYGDGPVPTMALLTVVDIPPIASKDYSDGNVIQKFLIAGSWNLSKVFSFGFNFGSVIDWNESDFTTLYTTSLGMSITSWMGAFVELYGFLPAGEYSDHRLDAGFIFPVRHNLQFDISGGLGISKNSPDGFGSLGFAWRIPR